MCEHCDAARVRTWGQYERSCTGCVARSIARSLVAWKALHAERNRRSVDDLREMVARMLPNTATDEARRLVLEWWERDHEQQEVSA